MKQNKQPSTRKPPALSAEEELAELLADPTLKPSISFLGLRDVVDSARRTDPVPGIETVPATVPVSGTAPVSDTDMLPSSPPPSIIFNWESVAGTAPVSDTAPISGTETESGPVSDIEAVAPLISVPATDMRPVLIRGRGESALPGATFRSDRYQAPKPKQALSVEDGHSHSEQHLYEALWNLAEPRDRDSRAITIGFGAMSRLARLSLNNCRLNTRSLIRKLAVEEIQGARCDEQIGKTYLIYNPHAILRRRKAAGLEWVVRTKGVVFVDASTGEMLTDPVTPTTSSKTSGQGSPRY